MVTNDQRLESDHYLLAIIDWYGAIGRSHSEGPERRIQLFEWRSVEEISLQSFYSLFHFQVKFGLPVANIPNQESLGAGVFDRALWKSHLIREVQNSPGSNSPHRDDKFLSLRDTNQFMKVVFLVLWGELYDECGWKPWSNLVANIVRADNFEVRRVGLTDFDQSWNLE